MFMKEALATIMTNEGLTATQMAEKLSITPGMISHYVNHEHYPRLSIATKIYMSYNIQVEPYTILALSTEMEKLL